MLRTGFLPLTASLLALLTLPLPAACASEGGNSEASSQRAYRTVRDSFEHIQFLTDNKPDPRAQYYLYLISASWCGPCRAEMPHIVEAYPRMKKDNRLEVILVGADYSEEGVRKYLDMFRATFPALMLGSEDAKKLPGCPAKVNAVPTLILVNAKGERIASGHGEIFDQWEELTAQKGKTSRQEANRHTPNHQRENTRR